jgi:hypothetical protein
MAEFSFRNRVAVRSQAALLPVLVLFCAVVASAASEKDAAFLPFTAQGSVLKRVFRDGEPNSYVATDAKFSFCYSNGWWRAEVTYLDPEKDRPSVQNCMSVPDGVRTFTLFQGSTNRGMTAASACPVSYPPPSMTELFAVWLAYCPRAQLPLLDEKRMRRFLLLPGCNLELMNHVKNEGVYSLDYSAPGRIFVRSLEITNNGLNLDMAVGGDGFPHPVMSRFPAPFDKGFCEFNYQMTEETNFNHCAFPKRGALKLFYLLGRNSRGEVAPNEIVEVRLERIQDFSAASNGSKQLSRMYALDARPPSLAPNQVAGYVVTNDQWKAVSDPYVRK